MRALLFLLSSLFPWPLRRIILQLLLGYKLDRDSAISRLALVLPKHLVMDRGATIGAFTICKGLNLMHVGECSSVGRLNYITGFPLGLSRHFATNKDRRPQLVLGRHAAITSRHIIDCTDAVTIGSFSTFAGFRSQILTHEIDLVNGRQSCGPVTIGEYSFVGTDSTILAGSSLPGRSVLGAKSLLNKNYKEEGYVYAGVPARPIATTSEGKYFTRSAGFVW